MGLLDNLGASFGNMTNDPKQMGLLMAAAQMMAQSGPSARPVGIGEILGGGMGAYMNTKNAMAQQQSDEEEREQLKQYRGTQMQGMQQKQQAEQQALLRSEQVRRMLAERQKPQAQAPAAPMDMGEAAPQQPAQGQPQGRDLYSELMGQAEYLQQQGYSQEAMQIAEQANKFKPKFDTTPRIANGPDGKPFTYVLDEMGNPKRLDGFMPREEKKLLNLNNKFKAVNPFEVPDGTSFNIGRSADNIASTNATLARLSFDKSQAAAPTFNAELGGFVSRPSQQAPQGSFTPLAGMASRGPKMTEDQAKATGWLSQAENAYKNMQGALKSTPGSAKPGFPDMVAGLPFGIGVQSANMMRGKDRQKFLQATSSMSEAFLRAATGAGVNRDEALQKQREIIPVWGDDDETIQQKMDAIPVYIDSLRVRAGPGAKLAGEIMQRNVERTGAGSSGWSITRADN